MTHRLAASGFDRDRGALFVRCACGWEDFVYRDPGWFDGRLVAEEAAQLERFRQHALSPVARAVSLESRAQGSRSAGEGV